MEKLAELGVATRAFPGESTCGDVHVVASIAGGLLVAAVDGVGHGEDAASAAHLAAAILKENAGEPVVALLMRCHGALRASRGAVMSVAALDVHSGSMTWVGVGNVIGTLLRRTGSRLAEESLLLRGGVVGGPSLPPLRAEVLCVSPGDTLVLATDGIASPFSKEVARNLPPQRAAEAILERHGRRSDDALVIVTRLLDRADAARGLRALHRGGGLSG